MSICEDWGWYIDTENIRVTNQYNYKIISKNKNNDIDYYLYRIQTIKEFDIEDLSFYNKKINKKNITIENSIFKVVSTTIITTLLTYFILFVL